MSGLLKFKAHKEEVAVKCGRCNQDGHIADNCKANRTCSHCFEDGHVAIDCPYPRESIRLLQPRVYVAGKGFVNREDAKMVSSGGRGSRESRQPPSGPRAIAEKRDRAPPLQHPPVQTDPKRLSKPPPPPCPWTRGPTVNSTPQTLRAAPRPVVPAPSPAHAAAESGTGRPTAVATRQKVELDDPEYDSVAVGLDEMSDVKPPLPRSCAPCGSSESSDTSQPSEDTPYHPTTNPVQHPTVGTDTKAAGTIQDEDANRDDNAAVSGATGRLEGLEDYGDDIDL